MSKRKLKKSVKKKIAIFIILLILIGGGIYAYKIHVYHNSLEYKLLEYGYTKENINILSKNVSDEDLNYLLTIKQNDKIVELTKEKYFLKKHLKDYIDYMNENVKKSLTDVVAIINVGANKDWYKEAEASDTSKEYLVLVNKFHYLEESFEPIEIVKMGSQYAYEGNRISNTVYDAFKEMANAAKQENLSLITNSSYREYASQKSIYEKFVQSGGEDYANSVAAKPGFSEHQTGLAIDVFSTTNLSTKTFQNSDEYKWLIDNSYKYGFILRYPENKTYLTGYAYESWHFRYVGIDVATKIHNENITFDEYYAYYIEK